MRMKLLKIINQLSICLFFLLTGKADDDAATQLITQIFELGALMITVRGNILRFQPPLVIKETDLDKAFSIIEQAMQELNDGKLPPAKPMGW